MTELERMSKLQIFILSYSQPNFYTSDPVVPIQWKLIEPNGEIRIVNSLSELEKKKPLAVGRYQAKFADGTYDNFGNEVYNITNEKKQIEYEKKLSGIWYLEEQSRLEASKIVNPIQNLKQPNDPQFKIEEAPIYGTPFLRTNYSNYLEMKRQAQDYFAKYQVSLNIPSMDVVYEKYLWPYFTEGERAQLENEDQRRNSLRQPDQQLTIVALLNPALTNTKWSFENPKEAAIAAAALASLGAAAGGGASLTFPNAVTMENVGQAAAAAIISEGTKAGEQLVSQEIKRIAQANTVQLPTIETERTDFTLIDENTSENFKAVVIATMTLGLIALL